MAGLWGEKDVSRAILLTIALPVTVILVKLVDWLSVPPVTVQESVPSSPSARGEIVRVPV